MANMASRWPPNSIKNRLKIDAKIDQKIDASWDRFLEGFGRILEPKWSHVGTQIDQKSMPLAKNEFLKNHCFFFRKNNYFEGSGCPSLGAKINEKSIKKGIQHGNASWHRFLMDLGGFPVSSWDGKSIKKR